jgi:hypothetical protein
MIFLHQVEILGHFSLAHNTFQKFLEISKPMCVSPCDMQPMFLAAQRQGVGAKFSPTWKVTTRNMLTSDHLIMTTEKLVIDL